MCRLQCPPAVVVALCVWPGQCSGGVGLWPVVTCPKRAVPVGMPGPWYGRIPGRVMLFDSPGRMANAVPAQPEVHPGAWCLYPGRCIPGRPSVLRDPPPPFSHWPMNMPEGAAGVRSPGKYSTRAGAGLGTARRGLVAWDCRRLDLVVSCARGCSRS